MHTHNRNTTPIAQLLINTYNLDLFIRAAQSVLCWVVISPCPISYLPDSLPEQHLARDKLLRLVHSLDNCTHMEKLLLSRNSCSLVTPSCQSAGLGSVLEVTIYRRVLMVTSMFDLQTEFRATSKLKLVTLDRSYPYLPLLFRLISDRLPQFSLQIRSLMDDWQKRHN